MGRGITRDMFPGGTGGTDETVLRRGDECDQRIITDVLAVIDGRISDDMRAAVLTLGLKPEQLDFTKESTVKYIEVTEDVANEERGRGQY